MIAHIFTMPSIITELCTWTQPGGVHVSPSLREDEPYHEVRTTTLDLSPCGCLLKCYTVSSMRRCLSAVVRPTANSQSNSIGIQYKQGTWERDPCFSPELICFVKYDFIRQSSSPFQLADRHDLSCLFLITLIKQSLHL